MRYASLFFLLSLLLISCSQNEIVNEVNSKEIPIAITSNNHFTLNPDNSITISNSNPDSCGYFRIHNFRNKHWPESYEIGFDDHKDFWFAGEFIPDFHNNSRDDSFGRKYNINLIQFYHIMYFQYIPTHWNRKFYFTSTLEYHKNTGGGPELYLFPKNEFNFDTGDTIRYIVKGDHFEDSIAVKVLFKNLTSEQTVVLNNNIKTIGEDLAHVKDIYFGSGSHGSYYHKEKHGWKSENFIGTITETLMGNSSISDSIAFQWINYQKKPASRIFDLKEIIPITIISITKDWYNNKGTEEYLRVISRHFFWDDPRYVLRNKSDLVSCKLDSIYLAKDLTKNYMSFYFRSLSSSNDNNIRLTLIGNNNSGIDKYRVIKLIDFSSTNKRAKWEGNVLHKHMKLSKEPQMYEINLLELYNDNQIDVADSVMLKGIEIIGHCEFGDVLLTDKPTLINIK